MPTSTWRNIETFIEIVIKTQSRSLLDIGIGNGKWGFLFREYADIWSERYLSSEWEARIDGIEIYEPYVQDHQRSTYSNIYIGNASVLVDRLGSYDIIMAGDVIEHIEKKEALALLRKLKDKAYNAVLISIPLGVDWLGNKVGDNEYEKHISSWSIEDFKGLEFQYYNITLAPDERRRIGFFVHFKKVVKIPGLKKLNKRFWRL